MDNAFYIKDLESKKKSKLIIGNFTIFTDKRFNWFNRMMIKLIFGIKVEKV